MESQRAPRMYTEAVQPGGLCIRVCGSVVVSQPGASACSWTGMVFATVSLIFLSDCDYC